MKVTFRTWLAACLALLGASAACGQSTDGYHSAQVLPVVVDSASFVQRFSFSTPNTFPVTVQPAFRPGNGGGAGSCDAFVIPAGGKRNFASLRDLCAGLPAGSVFGFLTLDAAPSSDDLYSDFPIFGVVSRISNAEGAGFSVEAFPAHTFTAGKTLVTGLRRLAATASSPAYQTNCFIGYMPNLNNTPPESVPGPAVDVNYVLHAGGNYAGKVTLDPGRMTRLLDVFATAGAPAGDYDEASIDFETSQATTEYGGVISFCTVQENSRYTADFRIGKVTAGFLGIATTDFLAAREYAPGFDGPKGRRFELDPGDNANTHRVYFRHPDTVQCRLLSTLDGSPLTAASGLEMRLLDRNGNLVGGGNDMTGTGQIYLGDKRNQGGANSRYTVEVESNQQNATVVRKYLMYCSSGSGNTSPDLAIYKEPVDRF